LEEVQSCSRQLLSLDKQFFLLLVLREQEQQEQEQPEQLAVLPSALRALASAAFSRPGDEEGPDVHDPASRSY